MDSKTGLDSTSRVTCAAARSELDRLLADSRFHATERTRSILRYLGERRIDGHDDSVKAYVIALDILGRSSNFDPSSDPIVRIEMSRLRSSLTQYYEAFGDGTNVSIHLPKGGYIADFSYIGERELAAGDDVSSSGDGSPSHNAQGPDARRAPEDRQTQSFAAGVAVTVLSLSGLIAGWYAMQPSITEKPVARITMFSDDDRLKGEASLTRDMLLTALTQFRTLSVSSNSPEEPFSASSGLPVRSHAYDIVVKYYADGNDRNVWWQIVDAKSGGLLKSGLEQVTADGREALGVREELVTLLSRRFAASRSIINTIESTDSAEGALGNACVLRAENDLDEDRLANFAAAQACLERTIARESADSDATAALARVIAAQAERNPTQAQSQRALDLASRAISLTPLSDRAQIAMMMVQFHSGRRDAAISAGNRALALNPNNPDVAASLGLVLFSSGYWDAGVSLAHDAGKGVDDVPRGAALVLALEAYRKGDWSSASLLAEQMNGGGLVAAMLKTAALAELGSGQAADRLAQVRSIKPGFEQNYAELMAARGFNASLADAIASGLVKAGARIAPRRVAASF